jgi:hypothetical protein
MEDIYCKCNTCGKKVLKEMSKCKCNQFHCRSHILNHNCTHDYKAIQSKILESSLIECKKRKIDTI